MSSLSSFIRISGWEDGKKVERELDKLDRWTTQNAETLQIYVDKDVQVSLKQDPHSNHLGGYIWDTSIIMAKYFASLPPATFYFKKWVELGSGIGFLGVVLEKLGATVTVTDIPELVPVMEMNIELNGCTKASAKALKWGEDKETIKELYNPDYVLLCDCVYSEANVQALVETLNEICGPETKIYSASELRNQDVMMRYLTFLSEHFDAKHVKDLPDFAEVENINVYLLTKRKLKA